MTWTAGYNWGTSQSFRIDLNTSLGWRPVVSSILSSERREYSRKVTDLDPNRDYQIRIKACNSAKGCNKDKFDEVLAFTTKGTVQVFHMLLMSLLSVHISISYPNNYKTIISLVMCVILTLFYLTVIGLIYKSCFKNRWMSTFYIYINSLLQWLLSSFSNTTLCTLLLYIRLYIRLMKCSCF